MISLPNSLPKQSSIHAALSLMDKCNCKLLVVTQSDGAYHSMLSIGDIQRAILKNIDLESPIEPILRDNVMVGRLSENRQKLTEFVLSNRIEFLPILDESDTIVDVIFWKDITNEKMEHSNVLSDVSVVIMAGGKGTRLRPITHVIPKPMVPIGEKSILQIIMEKFMSFGCRDFHFSVNYKAKMIEQHVQDLNLEGVTSSFFEEDQPLGTAGSLALLKEKIKGTFIVSNCDIVIDQDFSEVYDYHKQSENQLTAIAAMKRFSIPYGVMEVKENGQLESLNEKPSYDYRVNAGVYFLEASCLDHIPEDSFYNITDLMEDLMKDHKKVGVFPVSEGAWLDIGEWKEYQKTQEIFKAREL